MISIIAAVGRGLELGYQGDLIWRLPEDLKMFKETTKGHTILMGHKTFSSLPKLLPGRKHVVLTREPEKLILEAKKKGCSSNERPEVMPITELFEFLDKYKGVEEELFIIGGGSIYKQTIDMADKLYLTEIAADFPEADVYFPEFSREDFRREVVKKGRNENGLDYSFVVYTRQ
ncbi:dihydrofolate reductase [Candidatus Saccharibacteria bacterium]|nr:dihydrofolate reductase [Candidatus Saccharibacteria bacterium]